MVGGNMWCSNGGIRGIARDGGNDGLRLRLSRKCHPCCVIGVSTPLTQTLTLTLTLTQNLILTQTLTNYACNVVNWGSGELREWYLA